MTDPKLQARMKRALPGFVALFGGNSLLGASLLLRGHTGELIFGLSGDFWRGVLMSSGVILAAAGVALLVARIAAESGAQE